MNIEVSNLHLDVLESDLARMFAPYGDVTSVELLRDKVSRRSRGRAFVEMALEKDGIQAMKSLDGVELMGKSIAISALKYEPGQTSNSIAYKTYPTSFINLGQRSNENTL